MPRSSAKVHHVDTHWGGKFDLRKDVQSEVESVLNLEDDLDTAVKAFDKIDPILGQYLNAVEALDNGPRPIQVCKNVEALSRGALKLDIRLSELDSTTQ